MSYLIQYFFAILAIVINTKIVIKFWKEESDKSWKVANSLYKLKHYSECLFFCHLTLEKLLKGLIVQNTKQQAPYIHYLDTLVIKTGLPVTKKQMEQLKTISTFNIAGRYDNIKLSFYKKCTKEYTKKYFDTTKELQLWLNEKYQKS